MANPLENIPVVTRNLLYVNVIMFIATLINPAFMKDTFAMAYPLSIWFYLITGFGAVLLHTGVEFLEVQQLLAKYPGVSAQSIYNSIPGVLGASGAVYGVLVAFAMLYPEARLTLIFPPITLDAKWWVIIFIGIELVTGITGTQMGVAHFAHLGGALFGWLLIRYWRKSGKLYR